MAAALPGFSMPIYACRQAFNPNDAVGKQNKTGLCLGNGASSSDLSPTNRMWLKTIFKQFLLDYIRHIHFEPSN